MQHPSILDNEQTKLVLVLRVMTKSLHCKINKKNETLKLISLKLYCSLPNLNSAKRYKKMFGYFHTSQVPTRLNVFFNDFQKIYDPTMSQKVYDLQLIVLVLRMISISLPR